MATGDSVIVEAERILSILKAGDWVVLPERMNSTVVWYNNKGNEVAKRHFADYLSGSMSDYERWRGQSDALSKTFEEQAAEELVKAYNFGFIRGYLTKGDGLTRKLSDAESLIAKLKQDLEVITKEREAWKKRYEDCESAKFGTGGAMVGDVEESS